MIHMVQALVNVNVFFYVRVAFSFSSCAVTRVASMSMTTRPAWFGDLAQFHTRASATARAALVARQRRIRILGQAGDQPRHRRVRGHRDVEQAVL
jgi:hypothetical protein